MCHVATRTAILFWYVCRRMFVKFSYFCQLFFSSYKPLFGETPNKYSDTGSPPKHIGRGLGAIRTLWSAWQALKVFYSAGVDKTISLVPIREALFCTYVPLKCRHLFGKTIQHRHNSWHSIPTTKIADMPRFTYVSCHFQKNKKIKK